METTSNEQLVSLLIVKELEIKELKLYITQLEETYNTLCDRYNELMHLHFSKEKKRKQIGFRQNGGNK